jgi:dTDP-4-amino-4,6-dideoxygalactose transaminase
MLFVGKDSVFRMRAGYVYRTDAITMADTQNRSTILPFPSNASTSKVPLLDVGRGNNPLRDDFINAVARVIDSGRFLHGPEVTELEQEVARASGVGHAIACASGSDALLLALMAFDIGRDDEVIVPSFTFFATASAVWRLGAKPVFVDIDPLTFNLDPALVEKAITPATKAIIPVHLFGQCAEMDPLLSLAKRHGLAVIEDAAQAIGASYRGKFAGSMGDIGCLSFYPTKNLGGFGDGGMLTTNDADLAERLRLLASHGMQPRYHHREVGINSRLDTIQAAILSVKLKHLGDWATARSANAARYWQLFTSAGIDALVTLPTTASHFGHVWNQYTIRVGQGRRDEIRDRLQAAGVGCEIYYPIPLHQQQCFRALGYRTGDLPHTEQAAAEVLSLPIFPELTDTELQTVVLRLSEALRTKRAAA